MGLISRRVYLDACIVIYLVESHPLFGEPARKAIESTSNGIFCISPLLEMECLVAPLRQGNRQLVDRYRSFFASCANLDIPHEAYRLAAELRAHHGLKTPDALHLATALHHQCSEIWTNDERLNKASGGLAANVLAQR